MKIVVLSGKYAETKRFVKATNLPPHTPHIVNADRLRGIGSPRWRTEVHILPSYYDRRDLASIERMLKRAERFGEVVRYEWIDDHGVWTPAGGMTSFPNGELYASAPPKTPEDVLGEEPEVDIDDFFASIDDKDES